MVLAETSGNTVPNVMEAQTQPSQTFIHITSKPRQSVTIRRNITDYDFITAASVI